MSNLRYTSAQNPGYQDILDLFATVQELVLDLFPELLDGFPRDEASSKSAESNQGDSQEDETAMQEESGDLLFNFDSPEALQESILALIPGFFDNPGAPTTFGGLAPYYFDITCDLLNDQLKVLDELIQVEGTVLEPLFEEEMKCECDFFDVGLGFFFAPQRVFSGLKCNLPTSRTKVEASIDPLSQAVAVQVCYQPDGPLALAIDGEEAELPCIDLTLSTDAAASGFFLETCETSLEACECSPCPGDGVRLSCPNIETLIDGWDDAPDFLRSLNTQFDNACIKLTEIRAAEAGLAAWQAARELFQLIPIIPGLPNVPDIPGVPAIPSIPRPRWPFGRGGNLRG